jgi:hypothetical protein
MQTRPARLRIASPQRSGAKASALIAAAIRAKASALRIFERAVFAAEAQHETLSLRLLEWGS